MNRYQVCAFLGLLLAVAAAPVGQAQDGQKAPVSEDLKTLVQGNNEFAFDLYARLSDEKGNIVFSPYSISTALAMTYAGARGKTAKEMAKVLHFMLPQERLHAAFGGLIGDLQKDYKGRPYELTVANALWAQVGYPFGKEFLKFTENNYGAAIRFVDFDANAEQARNTINRWVEEQTRDKIKELVGPADIRPKKTRFVLANAIYFKANWKKQFPKDQTKDKVFELASGEKPLVPMMHQKGGPFNYTAGGGNQWLELPYQGDRLSMLLILPQKKGALPDLEKTLNASVIQKGVENLHPTMGEIALPRFKMTVRFNLLDELARMGMPVGPFHGIGGDFYLHFVVHKAFVDLDETGTEAAAATAVGGGPGSGGPVPFSFQGDHPFLFLIRDRQTGSVLFQGRVADPRS